jgi:hypothetical protein
MSRAGSCPGVESVVAHGSEDGFGQVSLQASTQIAELAHHAAPTFSSALRRR